MAKAQTQQDLDDQAEVKSAHASAVSSSSSDDQVKARATTDEALGQILRLMMASPKHRHMFLADMEVQVVPPMRLGQCRVLRNEKGIPFAYAAWARVSEEVERRLQAGEHRLRPQDWNSGDRPWLIDIAASNQAIPIVMEELQKHVFKGEKVKTLT